MWTFNTRCIPCEAFSISEEYTAAKEGNFVTMLKEPLAKFLACSYIKQIQSLYQLKMVQVQQIFMENLPH
jgi:hypothetical protein